MSASVAAMLAPLLASVLLAVAARSLGRFLPPATAVRLLVVATLTTALSGGFVLAVLAFTLAAQNAWLAHLGGWSPAEIRVLDPVAPVAGIAAGVAVTGLFVAAVWRAAGTVRALWAAGVTCRRLGAGTHGLVVVDDPRPDAYAVAGISGRVVVSTGMLRALSGPERRVLFAHESAHLNHHHHLYLALVDLAAAANPFLRPAATAVHLGVERWADEDAAAAVGDRTLAARAVAQAALARSAHTRQRLPATALAMTAGPVVARTRALLDPPPRPRRLLAATLLALTLATAASAVVVDHTTEHRFEQAQSADGP